MREARPKYQPHIDGLRAVAVLGVVGYHAFPLVDRGGFIGVDIFFVISGFLISTILFAEFASREHAPGRVIIAHFYARRVRRIFPSLVLVLGCCSVLGYLTLLPVELRKLGFHVVAGAGFCINFLLANETGYFGGAALSHPLLHLWSLAVEEQFYLFWPLLIWLAAKSRVRFLYLAVFVGACSYFWNSEKSEAAAAAAFFLPQMRLWELLIGAVAALGAKSLSESLPSRPRLISEALSITGSILVAAGFAVIASRTDFPNSPALLPTLGTALLMCSNNSEWINRRLLSHPLMVNIGLISYPLYLWHWPLLSYAQISLANGNSAGFRVAAVVLSFVLAWLTTRFVERPIRYGGKAGVKIAGLLAAMTLAAAAGLIFIHTDGFPQRFPKIIQDLSNFSYDTGKIWRTGSYFLTGASDDREFRNDPAEIDGTKPSMVLWGDSHAAALYPGLIKRYRATYNIVQRTTGNLAPFIGGAAAAGSSNAALNGEVMATIRRLRPAYVVLESNWVNFGYKDVEPTIIAIKAAGVPHVVLVGPVPQWDVSLPQQVCNYVRNHRSDPVPIRLGSGYRPEPLEIDPQMRAMAERLGAQYVSPCDILGNKDGFLVRLGDTPESFVEFDYGHLTEEGSVFLVSRFPEF